MHSLVSTISIVSQLVGGVLKLPTAKLLDMWGRGEGFVIMLTFSVIGEPSKPPWFIKSTDQLY